MPQTDVLLVEDDGTTRKLVAAMLTDLGYSVEVAATAAQGMEAFDRSRFAVVLCDVNLPDLDGIEMLRRLRATDSTLMAIVMTSERDQEVALRAMECGIRGFLPKPFDRSRLQQQVEAAVQEREKIISTRLLMGDLLRKRAGFQEAVQNQHRRLTLTESYLQHVLDASPFAVLSTDTEDRILTFNGTAAAMYGYTPEEMIGQPLSLLFAAPPAASTQEKRTHRHKSGETFPVLMRNGDILDLTQQCIGRLYVVEDLREREALEEQLFYAERLSLLGQMAPRIAHEFKTPLQIIDGYTGLVLQSLRNGEVEQSLAFAELIPPAVKQVLDLVEQIATLGKPTQSKQTRLDLAAEMEKILRPLQGLGAVKYCEVVRDFSPSLPAIQGDPAQIEQVFRNLIVNAAHAMEGSSQRVISLRLQPSADGQWVEAEVGDTGTGIAAENLQTIFQPFFTTKPEGKGTGLGLPIVKSILDRHGATIRVESTEGVGTRFHLCFPALQDPEDGDASPEQRRTP